MRRVSHNAPHIHIIIIIIIIHTRIILVGEEIFFGRPTGICVAFMIYGGCFYHTVSGFVIKADGVK